MHLYSFKNPKPEKTCAVVRYGAIGDAMQATSIFPALKAQGYHLTFYTVPLGYEVTQHDPHVDRFIVQDVDLIPNADLGSLWASLEKKYDRFINLSESVERTLLVMPGNMSHGWSHAMRHKYLNRNYVEFVHDIAGVPLPCRTQFYATEEEQQWAKQAHEAIGGNVIVWVLSGSAVHKVWPYLDVAMHRILRNWPVNFVLVGDKDCQMLEAGWENHPRVHCRSGKWSIRETLAFAQAAAMVIGPETGILNAVSMEPMPKIVLLSHSSEENLTRDWVNCMSHAAATECYPCHRLHVLENGFKHCNESKEVPGIAACQAELLPGVVVTSIERVLRAA